MAIRTRKQDIIPIKAEKLRKQKGKCPLCNKDLTKMQSSNVCLDHDHTTGALRGALCKNCNGQEGRIKNQAIRCSSLKGYMNWIIRLGNYYYEHIKNPDNRLHHTYKTETEKRLNRNKRARAVYKKKVKNGR